VALAVAIASGGGSSLAAETIITTVIMMTFMFVTLIATTTILMDTLVTTTVTGLLSILATKQYLIGEASASLFFGYFLDLISVDDNNSNSCLPRNSTFSFGAIFLSGPATFSRSSSSSSLEAT